MSFFSNNTLCLTLSSGTKSKIKDFRFRCFSRKKCSLLVLKVKKCKKV